MAACSTLPTTPPTTAAPITTVAITQTTPKGPCQEWCAQKGESKGWDKLCSWQDCQGCSQCHAKSVTTVEATSSTRVLQRRSTAKPIAAACKDWCPKMRKKSWDTLCSWRDCSGCSQCNGNSATTTHARVKIAVLNRPVCECATFTQTGKRSCCARGGSWFQDCGNAGAGAAHTWVEGMEACASASGSGEAAARDIMHGSNGEPKETTATGSVCVQCGAIVRSGKISCC